MNVKVFLLLIVLALAPILLRAEYKLDIILTLLIRLFLPDMSIYTRQRVLNGS
jgi:hypothetical protein